MAYRQTEKTRERNALRRQQIIDAAREIFARNGFETATMNQIVRKAGTSIGNCYFYFPNKDALLTAIIREIIAEIWSFADERKLSVKSGAGKLAVILYKSSLIMMENEDIARLMIAGNSVDTARKAMFEDFANRIRDLLTEDPSLNKGGNVELEIYASHGIIMTLLERRRTGEINYSPEEISLFLVRWIFRALDIPKHDIDSAVDYLITVTSSDSSEQQSSDAD